VAEDTGRHRLLGEDHQQDRPSVADGFHGVNSSGLVMLKGTLAAVEKLETLSLDLTNPIDLGTISVILIGNRLQGFLVGVLSYMVVLAILIGVLVLLMAPIKLRFDSRQKRLTFHWMGLSATRKLRREKLGETQEEGEREKGRIIKTVGRLFLKDRYLTLELLLKAYRPFVYLLRSVSVRELEASFSTPDPMWNGVLFGIVNNIHHKNARLSVNFQGINYLRGCLEIRPYRLLHATISMLVHLPYRRIIRTILGIRKTERKEETS
jgi:hypothetical protein